MSDFLYIKFHYYLCVKFNNLYWAKVHLQERDPVLIWKYQGMDYLLIPLAIS